MAKMLGWRLHICLPFTEHWRDWREYGDPAGIFVRRMDDCLHCLDHWRWFYPFAPRWFREMLAAWDREEAELTRVRLRPVDESEDVW